jgi:hypothetical protein
VKSWFGGGDMEEEVEGGMISNSDIKNSYNKNVKNTQLGKALREGVEKGISDVYDKGVVKIGNTKHFNGIADVFKKGKKGNVSMLTQVSGLGLKLQQGDGLRMSGNGMRCKGCGMAYNGKCILEINHFDFFSKLKHNHF